MSAPEQTSAAPLRLLAETQEDLQAMSALAQDAVGYPADARWLKSERRFVVMFNRFCWELEGAPRRIRSALSFETVEEVRARGFNLLEGEALLNLLSITFELQGEGPGGRVLIRCADRIDIRLDVEALEARLTDMGAPWFVAHRPSHGGAEKSGFWSWVAGRFKRG